MPASDHGDDLLVHKYFGVVFRIERPFGQIANYNIEFPHPKSGQQ